MLTTLHVLLLPEGKAHLDSVNPIAQTGIAWQQGHSQVYFGISCSMLSVQIKLNKIRWSVTFFAMLTQSFAELTCIPTKWNW